MGTRVDGSSSTVTQSTSTAAPETTTDVGGKTGPQQSTQTSQAPSTDTAQQTKGAQQHAISQQSEVKLQTQAKGLAPTASKDQQIASITDAAKKSGLEDAEVTKLKTRLQGLEGAAFRSEASFLRNNVLHTANTDRALRTYNELKGMQDKSGPDRLTNEHIRVLTRGVAESRTANTRGLEGVIGQDAAIKAGKALIEMPKGDYDKLSTMLNKAGKGTDGKIVNGSSPQMEKALILKAVAARQDALSNPSIGERFKTWVGKPSTSMAEIQGFAKDIRGMQRSVLAQKTTATDPYAGNKALQQRWNDSCGPTTAQGIKADSDPVYALKLHKEFIHSTSRGGDIGKEQKTVLEAHGGVAVPRDTTGGAGVPGSTLWNDQISKYTGIKYTATPCVDSVAGRNASLDAAAEKLKRGIDVPIRAGWPSGGGHFMFLSDVRGTGDNQKFLLTDPWKGTTSWVSRKDLASGNTNFPAGTGKLTHVY